MMRILDAKRTSLHQKNLFLFKDVEYQLNIVDNLKVCRIEAWKEINRPLWHDAVNTGDGGQQAMGSISLFQ